MDVISSFKKQKVLHLTTVTDAELLGVGGVASRPTPHPIAPFRQDQEEGACIMQLDLMKAAHKASTEPETELQANLMDTSTGESNSRLVENSETQGNRRDQELLNEKKLVFEQMQKSYTELSQLLTLTQSLHSEKYMTLLTCTRPGGLQPVGTSLPAMQRIAILKSNLQSLVKPLQDSARKISQLSKQRQVFTHRLLQLKRKWKLSTNLTGSRGRRALTGKDVLAIDCGLGVKNTGVLSMLGSCIVPLLMDNTGQVKLPVLEKTRTFNTLCAEICTPQGLTLVSCNSWDILKQNLLPLGVSELEEVHQHCQQRQQEMLDSALIACVRTDASTRSNRWILAPPISARESFATAIISNRQTQSQTLMQIHINQQIESALFECAHIPVSTSLEFSVQVVHRAEVVIRLTDSLLLRFQLKPVESSSSSSQQQYQNVEKQKQTNILQEKALRMLSDSLLSMHVSMLRDVLMKSEAAGGKAGGDAGAGSGAGESTTPTTPTVLPLCIKNLCSALRTLS